MRRTARALARILILIACATACSQFTVRADRDPSVDFSRFRTYAWLPRELAPPVDQDVGDRHIDRRIAAAIDANLARKGYVAAAGKAPDLFVTYRLTRTDTYVEPNLPYTLGWRRGTYIDAVHASADSYERGSLIVDVIDAGANVLVWRGSASARLLRLPYEKAVKRGEEAVAKIFEGYPAR